ncbi:hypothetical protein SAY86_028519 [Trapa natans]|uniref:Uncharacterized protein n=1 Tax=Trapa natans TaxID=22666 RepID=A0AAN7MIL1_TRANT|nr:hypothetical protein SAY86_028519 [Trapa natans]
MEWYSSKDELEHPSQLSISNPKYRPQMNITATNLTPPDTYWIFPSCSAPSLLWLPRWPDLRPQLGQSRPPAVKVASVDLGLRCAAARTPLRRGRAGSADAANYETLPGSRRPTGNSRRPSLR